MQIADYEDYAAANGANHPNRSRVKLGDRVITSEYGDGEVVEVDRRYPRRHMYGVKLDKPWLGQDIVFFWRREIKKGA